MAQVVRRYRQVSVVQQGGGAPRVQGMEEVIVNGRRQVRYWGDPQWLADDHSVADGVEGLPQGQMGSAQPKPWQGMQASVTRGVERVKRVVKNVPQALRAAWVELKR